MKKIKKPTSLFLSVSILAYSLDAASMMPGIERGGDPLQTVQSAASTMTGGDNPQTVQSAASTMTVSDAPINPGTLVADFVARMAETVLLRVLHVQQENTVLTERHYDLSAKHALFVEAAQKWGGNMLSKFETPTSLEGREANNRNIIGELRSSYEGLGNFCGELLSELQEKRSEVVRLTQLAHDQQSEIDALTEAARPAAAGIATSVVAAKPALLKRVFLSTAAAAAVVYGAPAILPVVALPALSFVPGVVAGLFSYTPFQTTVTVGMVSAFSWGALNHHFPREVAQEVQKVSSFVNEKTALVLEVANSRFPEQVKKLSELKEEVGTLSSSTLSAVAGYNYSEFFGNQVKKLTELREKVGAFLSEKVSKVKEYNYAEALEAFKKWGSALVMGGDHSAVAEKSAQEGDVENSPSSDDNNF